MNFDTGRVEVTEQTISIHHFKTSWHSEKERTKRYISLKYGKCATEIYNIFL